MKKRAPWMARQGDVLIYPCAHTPIAPLVEIAREHGAVVLAHGEVTGHSHQIRATGVRHLRQESNDAYTLLRVPAGVRALLEHEEHATIEIPPGDYHVVIQQEYTPEEMRNVVD